MAPPAEEAANGKNEVPKVDCNWHTYPPMVFSALVPAMVLICYVNGVIKTHYYLFLPLISDTGNFIPESGLFAVFLSVAAVFWMITVTLRYLQLRAIIYDPHFMFFLAESHRRQIRERDAKAKLHPLPRKNPWGWFQVNTEDNFEDIQFYRDNYTYYRQIHNYHCWNLFGFLVGIATGLSCCGLAAFRIHESFIFHHLFGFGIMMNSMIYMLIQVRFSYVMYPQVNSKAMYKRRKWIAYLAGIALSIFLSSTCGLFFFFTGDFINPRKRLFWGGMVHYVNSLSEWIYVLSLSPFIFTFVDEFSRLFVERLKLDFPFGNMATAFTLRSLVWYQWSIKLENFAGENVTLLQRARWKASQKDGKKEKKGRDLEMQPLIEAEDKEDVLYDRTSSASGSKSRRQAV